MCNSLSKVHMWNGLFCSLVDCSKWVTKSLLHAYFGDKVCENKTEMIFHNCQDAEPQLGTPCGVIVGLCLAWDPMWSPPQPV